MAIANQSPADDGMRRAHDLQVSKHETSNAAAKVRPFVPPSFDAAAAAECGDQLAVAKFFNGPTFYLLSLKS